jgi:hypothetical protein
MVHNVRMFRLASYRRRLADRPRLILGAQLCALVLAVILGAMPFVEMHAHAGGERAHVHDADHPAAIGHDASALADEASLVVHVHDSNLVSQAQLEVYAIGLDDRRLIPPQFLPLLASRGTEPPAPPRRPPIA